VHKVCITNGTQGNNSHRKERKAITDIRSQKRIKLNRGIDEPMRVRKVTSILNREKVKPFPLKS
jgi:hypothetical protein